MRMMIKTLLLTVAIAAGLGTTQASAATLLGNPDLTPTEGSFNCLCTSWTIDAPYPVASSQDGRVVRWGTYQAAPGPVRLLVLRRLSPSIWYVAQRGPEHSATQGINFFNDSIPILTGEVIAVHAENTGRRSGTGDTYAVGLGHLDEEGEQVSPGAPNGSNIQLLLNAYVTAAAPQIDSVSPASGPTAGGNEVTITGSNMMGTTAVKFGAADATFTVDSDTQITATVPGGSDGAVNVTATNPLGTSNAGSYTYAGVAPQLTSLAPTVGPAAGGNEVTITGTDLTDVNSVQFGGTPANSFVVDSDTQITAVAPAHAVGSVTVSVASPAGSDTLSDSYEYRPAPQVTDVNPRELSAVGGQTVAITGEGFTGATDVTIDNTPVSFIVSSDTQIEVTTPAGLNAGSTDVVVSTAGGDSATGTASEVTIYAQPTVTAVSPTSGPLAGGTTITVTGTGFSSAPIVQVGGENATDVQRISATQLTAKTPARPAGSYDVAVTAVGGTSTPSSASKFTYHVAPTLASIAPPHGPTSGATAVTITGSGLTGVSEVLFGGVPATNVQVLSDHQLTALTPAHSAGEVAITATGPGGISSGAPLTFTYDAPPTPPSPTPTPTPEPVPDPTPTPVPPTPGPTPSPVPQPDLPVLTCGRVPELEDQSLRYARRVLRRDDCHAPVILRGERPSDVGARRVRIRRQEPEAGTPRYDEQPIILHLARRPLPRR